MLYAVLTLFSPATIQGFWTVLLRFASYDVCQQKLITLVDIRIELREKPSYIPLIFLKKHFFKVGSCQLVILHQDFSAIAVFFIASIRGIDQLFVCVQGNSRSLLSANFW